MSPERRTGTNDRRIVEEHHFRVPKALTYVYVAALIFCAVVGGVGAWGTLTTMKNVEEIEKLREERVKEVAATTFANCRRVNRADRHNDEQDHTLMELLDAATDTRAETFGRVAKEQRARTAARIRHRQNDDLKADDTEPRDCTKLPALRPFKEHR